VKGASPCVDESKFCISFVLICSLSGENVASISRRQKLIRGMSPSAVVVGNFTAGSGPCRAIRKRQRDLLARCGRRNFSQPRTLTLGGAYPTRWWWDLNRDGKPDSWSQSPETSWRQQQLFRLVREQRQSVTREQRGTFSGCSASCDGGFARLSVTAGDLNGDGRQTLLC